MCEGLNFITHATWGLGLINALFYVWFWRRRWQISQEYAKEMDRLLTKVMKDLEELAEEKACPVHGWGDR